MKDFNSSSDILALDFDGVIVDSIQECLVSGYNAYCAYSDCGEPVERFQDLDPAWTAAARRMRNFIRNGEDYLYIAHALARESAINGQDDFDAFLREHADLRHIFYDLMTAQRISFSNARPEEWAALNPLYDGMRDFLATHPNKENVYIITTKKLLFVHLILDAHDVQLIDANIHGTSVNRTKRHIIQDILQDRGAQAARFYFLDDQVDTLIKVKPTGVQTILAGWGYNDAGQRALAAKEDIPVFTLRQFYATFEST